VDVEVRIKSGFEIIAVVEDLKTLRSTAAVRILIETESGQTLHDKIALIEVPEDV
jgi:hypothetical protein